VLRLAGIASATPDPAAASSIAARDQGADGLLRDNAMGLVDRLVLCRRRDDRDRVRRHSTRCARSHHSVQDMDGSAPVTRPSSSATTSAQASGQATAHPLYWRRYGGHRSQGWACSQLRRPLLSIGAFKEFIDGSLGSAPPRC